MIVINFVIVSPSALQFDDILHSIGEFGPRQRVIYIVCCAVVIIPSGIQFAGGFFFTGTPEFHCITPGVKCDLNKCCTNCTKYQFTTFTSAVTEVGMFTFPCLHVVFVCMLCSFTVQKGLTIGRCWQRTGLCAAVFRENSKKSYKCIFLFMALIHLQQQTGVGCTGLCGLKQWRAQLMLFLFSAKGYDLNLFVKS